MFSIKAFICDNSKKSRSNLTILTEFRSVILLMIAVILVLAVAIIRYRSDEVNYRNADATWHTLLTIKAYDETDVSEHLFLPIVSLGEKDDKFIPWGSTVSDKNGNYYYTSFSPMGYFAPWLFLKIFRLPICEKSLYVFNNVLFAISAVLWTILLLLVYKKEKTVYWLAGIGLLTYVLSPELLHGMGIVYWHQSVMQVTLLMQIIAFWNMNETDSGIAKITFFVLALINPYIEWTGYVANVGFGLAELIIRYKNPEKKVFRKVMLLGFTTLASFLLFCGHYLLRTDTVAFFNALKNRFMARNVASTTTHLIDVFKGYLDSFLYLWLLFIFLIVWSLAKKSEITIKHRMLMFILAFPALENVVMKQHAISYTYDRMKCSFLLSFLICELVQQIMKNYYKKRKIAIVLLLLTMGTGFFNLYTYMNDESYIWQTNYRNENEIIAEYINYKYPDAVLGLEDASVRGYMNCLFDRGIYEFMDGDRLKDIAINKKRQYAVLINIEDIAHGNIYDLGGATVYDTLSGDITRIYVKDGKIQTNQKSIK